MAAAAPVALPPGASLLHGGFVHGVKDVRALPGGSYVLASGDHAYKVFDIRTGRCIATHRMPSPTSAYALHPLGHGRFLVEHSTGKEPQFRVMDCSSGGDECVTLALMAGDGGADVNAFASWGSQRSVLLSGGAAGVKVWRLPTTLGSQPLDVEAPQRFGGPLAVFEGHRLPVLALAALPCSADPAGCSCHPCPGHLFASGSEDGGIAVWRLPATIVAAATDEAPLVDVPPGLVPITTPLLRLGGHSAAVRALLTLADGRLASASTDKTVRVWDVAAALAGGASELEASSSTGLCQVLRGHEQAVTKLTQLPGGELVSGGYDKSVRVWGLGGEPACLAACSGVHTDWVNGLAPVPLPGAGEHVWGVVSASEDGTLALWGPSSATASSSSSSSPWACIRVFEEFIFNLGATPSGSLLNGSNRSLKRLVDGRWVRVGETSMAAADADGKVLSSPHHNGRIWSLAVGAAETRARVLAATGDTKGTVKVWSLPDDGSGGSAFVDSSCIASFSAGRGTVGPMAFVTLCPAVEGDGASSPPPPPPLLAVASGTELKTYTATTGLGMHRLVGSEGVIRAVVAWGAHVGALTDDGALTVWGPLTPTSPPLLDASSESTPAPPSPAPVPEPAAPPAVVTRGVASGLAGLFAAGGGRPSLGLGRPAAPPGPPLAVVPPGAVVLLPGAPRDACVLPGGAMLAVATSEGVVFVDLASFTVRASTPGSSVPALLPVVASKVLGLAGGARVATIEDDTGAAHLLKVWGVESLACGMEVALPYGWVPAAVARSAERDEGEQQVAVAVNGDVVAVRV